MFNSINLDIDLAFYNVLKIFSNMLRYELKMLIILNLRIKLPAFQQHFLLIFFIKSPEKGRNSKGDNDFQIKMAAPLLRGSENELVHDC